MRGTTVRVLTGEVSDPNFSSTMAQRRRSVSGFGRRAFLSGIAGGLAAWRRPASAAEPPKKPQSGAPAPEDFKLPPGGHMPTRALGRTGVEVSLLGLGGFHIGLAKDEATAARIVRTAIDHGRELSRQLLGSYNVTGAARCGWAARCATGTASGRF